jgi:hypothetical protein
VGRFLRDGGDETQLIAHKLRCYYMVKPIGILPPVHYIYNHECQIATLSRSLNVFQTEGVLQALKTHHLQGCHVEFGFSAFAGCRPCFVFHIPKEALV